jgi:hypothetical protein
MQMNTIEIIIIITVCGVAVLLYWIYFVRNRTAAAADTATTTTAAAAAEPTVLTTTQEHMSDPLHIDHTPDSDSNLSSSLSLEREPARVYPCFDNTSHASISIGDESTMILDLCCKLNSPEYLCIICSQPIRDIQPTSKLISCMHTFHKTCIMDWFTYQYRSKATYTCPICREIPDNSITITIGSIIIRDGQLIM